jgi:thiol-disulfide isomerase/thioredoxin
MLWYTTDIAATPSTMLPLETAAPPFALPDVVSGETISLETFTDKKALLVMFLCRHCKYVQHVKQALTTLEQEYQGIDLGIVAISANDAAAYAEDAPESHGSGRVVRLPLLLRRNPRRGQSLYCCVHS